MAVSRATAGTLFRTEQAQRLKALEQENSRLKRLVADLSLDNAMLRETVSGNPGPPPGRADQPGKTTAGGGALEVDVCRFGTMRLPGARSAPLPQGLRLGQAANATVRRHPKRKNG
jgi:hypothetical protein